MRPTVYTRLGATLLLAGAIAAPIFSFVAGSIPLTALALASVLLGAISLFLAGSLPAVPPQAAELLLHAGLENVARLLEEIGSDAKAIYLPSRLSGGKPRALIPLHANAAQPKVSRPLLDRLIVDFGPHAEDMGILVTTPGTAVVELLETRPGATSSALEAALARVLIGMLDLATAVQVSQEDGSVTVTMTGVRLTYPDLWIYQALGTPLASLAATLVAEGLDTPVTIRSEARREGRATVLLDVIG